MHLGSDRAQRTHAWTHVDTRALQVQRHLTRTVLWDGASTLLESPIVFHARCIAFTFARAIDVSLFEHRCIREREFSISQTREDVER